MTRCKVVCEHVQNFVGGSSIQMRPVHSGSEENESFYQYTPGGEIKLEVVHPEVAKQFEPGKEYYVDISPCE